MLQVDQREITDLVHDLGTIRQKALLHATRKGLNTTAKAGQKVYRDEAARSMILRNAFTKKSITFRRARGTAINRLESFTGSTERYMRDQEDGKTLRRSGRFGVPIPTSVASREGRGKVPRRRNVMKSRRMQAIKLRGRKRGMTREAQNAAAMRAAKKHGDEFVFLRLRGNRQGIFRLRKGKGKRGGVDMVWDLSRPSVRIPKNPMLRRTRDKMIPVVPAFHRSALQEELRLQRLRTRKK